MTLELMETKQTINKKNTKTHKDHDIQKVNKRSFTLNVGLSNKG